MDLSGVLSTHQLRVTSNRLKVLELMYQKEYAISQQELTEALPPSFDRVTLYRILNQFEENGIIHKVINPDGQQVYAVCSHECDHTHHADEHFHFYCESCEKTYCLEDVKIPSPELPLGYTLQSLNINGKGVCKDCNN